MKILTNLMLLAFVGGIYGGQYFQSNGTKYYFSAPMKMNWFQAQRFCHANSMYLATVHNEEEYRMLLDVINVKFQSTKSDDHFWSSGTDMGPNDLEFYWFESGHAILYANWIDGSPVAKRDGCILLHADHKYKFWDELCTTKWFFICQDRMHIPDASKRITNGSYFIDGTY